MIDTIGLWVALTALSPALGDPDSVGSAAVMPRPDAAQTCDPAVPLAPGARVRITSPLRGGRPLVGQLVSVSADTLRVRVHESGGVTTLQIDDQTLVELSARHHSRAAAGAVTGGLLGGAVGASIVSYQQGMNEFGDAIGELFGAPASPSKKVSSAPIFLGLVLGGVLGGLIGSGISVDNWVPASVPVSVTLRGSPDPAGRFRAALFLSLRRSP